jgi:purine-binding chemotaxis protein CheW
MPLMLLFRIGSSHYGLEVEAIQEVADAPTLHVVPASHGPLLGAINAHGRVLPVIDLPGLLGVATAPLDPRLVVLNPQLHALALAVSAVGRIVPFADDSVFSAPEDGGADAVAGVVEVDDRQVNLLDVDAVVERLETIYAA